MSTVFKSDTPSLNITVGVSHNDTNDLKIISAINQIVKIVSPGFEEWSRVLGYLRNKSLTEMLNPKTKIGKD